MTGTYLALLVIAVVGVFMLSAMMASGSKKRRGTSARGSVDRAMVAERWQAIQLGAGSGGAGLKNAIMEADKLLDYAMKGSGFRGETMGERLKSPASSRFSDLNAIWRAHKLRNHFAHEVGADLVASQAHEALRDFERALRDLGVL
ncbi:MAG TPA: hypothetical protein VLF41_00445 [Candidatus Nanoarchaeia archaeon]|nr:hypothetical protein [Candidatus Nanoarchaeia archaeon]